MAELLTPGVFIQEVDFGPQPIEGVSTSTAGFVGETERGPVTGPPTLVTSFPDFQRKFGGFVSGKALAYAVRGFFDNGGRRAFISRVVEGTPDPASRIFTSSGYRVQLLAISVNATTGVTSLTLSSVVGLVTTSAQVRIFRKSDDTIEGAAHTAATVNGAIGVVTVNTPLDTSVITPAAHYARITPDVAVAPNVLEIRARDPGLFGNQLAVLVDAHYVNNSRVVSQPTLPSPTLVLSAVDFLEVGSKVELETADGTAREVATVQAIDSATRTVTLTTDVNIVYAGGKLFLIGWRISVVFDGEVVETLTALSTVLDSLSNATTFATQVAARSQWIRIDTATPPTLSPISNLFPTFTLAQPALLSGAADTGDAEASDVIGLDTPARSGLKAIEAQDGINIIAAPGFTDILEVSELIAQAERRMDRFAVFESSFPVDPNVPPPEVPAVLTERGNYNSRFGAMYHPWILVLDPLTGTTIPLPPSGHVLGAYARTDNDRGVFKAPANVVLRGIGGFTQDITNGEQDLLNPAGVNVLRRFEGLGLVIWGARTISAETLWKYVPVRRLFIFLEQSIVKGTRFAVFEPNDLRLWARLRDAVTNFLTTQWRAGALFGARPEEAFFVKVDETTTTQDDRDNGRVNIIVGIAPVKPAEFIVFQIGQAPQSVIIAEQG